MGQMVNTKFGLVSRTEARCLGDLERQLKDGRWQRKRPQRPRKPRITVWRKGDVEKHGPFNLHKTKEEEQ
ncbi:hypothetical protein [Levilactobacillus brevis]|uniref:hypothetical protein n=1 Tax=Levilactobacillus brevis TaxID=1580 RepID=UPI000848222E|nr:hypothetical protein [Levilactobacillus brevis]ODP94829.1 hypothetical protein BGC39_10845 [Levilactobacillus brevis]